MFSHSFILSQVKTRAKYTLEGGNVESILFQFLPSRVIMTSVKSLKEF